MSVGTKEVTKWLGQILVNLKPVNKSNIAKMNVEVCVPQLKSFLKKVAYRRAP
jgi:hypothetical protein